MKKSSTLESIDQISKLVFSLSLLAIPISIIPFPWDLTEYSMALVLGFAAAIILSLEFIKLIIKGNISFPKISMDVGLLFFLLAMLVSTIFSASKSTSLWGYDFRLGSGFVFISLLFVYAYSIRSFLKSLDDIASSFGFLTLGISIAAAISLLSFWGMNPLSFIPSFKTLFTTGLPIYASARISLLVFGVGLLSSLGMLIYSLRDYKLAGTAYYLVLFLINFVAVLMFSMVQGYDQMFLIIGVVALFLIIPIFRKRPVNKVFFGVGLSAVLLLALFFGLLRIPKIRELVVQDSAKVITQITIDPSVTWKVTTSALSESLKNGVVGFGNDTFSIAYNQYRPLTQETLLLNDINFTFANNQILNTLSGMGLLGIGLWLFIGYLLLKQYLTMFKKVTFESKHDMVLLLVFLASVYVYISSVFIYFTFLSYLLLFIFISYIAILGRGRVEEESELFVFNLGVFIHGKGNSMDKTVYLGFFAGVMALFIWAMSYLGGHFLSGLNIVEAERITAEGRALLDRNKLSQEDKAKMLIDASNLYGKAVAQNNQNSMAHRRASIIIAQYIEYLAKEYNDAESEIDKRALFDEITTYVEIVVEEAKKATEFSPKVYSNWNARATVYSKLVGLGLNSYSKSALTSMQEAASLNPLNYELYYNAAQLYVINDDSGLALRTLSQVFSINPEHIPSLILAGELSVKDADYKQADRYFSDAKTVLDNLENTNSDIYRYIVEKLNELSNIAEGGTSKEEIIPESTETDGSESLVPVDNQVGN